MNVVVLRGVLSSEPWVRQLTSGSVVWNLEVTTRASDGASRDGASRRGAACSAPVAWFDPPPSTELAAGDEVVVVGGVRRRFFRVGGSTHSRTEVVAEAVVPVARTREVRRVIERAVAAVSVPPQPRRVRS